MSEKVCAIPAVAIVRPAPIAIVFFDSMIDGLTIRMLGLSLMGIEPNVIVIVYLPEMVNM